MLETNTIYCGDNLEQLKKIPDNSVDLIYIDPPFNSSRRYEIFWEDSQESRAFHDRFGDAEAYIFYMRPRIVELQRVLKKTGSFYYHCDWHASHYVKIMLDQVFGANNFINEIIWKRQSAHSDAKTKYPVVTETIFFYSGGGKITFNPEFGEHDPTYVQRAYHFDGKDGLGAYRLGDMSAPAGGGMAARNKRTGRPNGWYVYKGFQPPARGWRYSPETMKRLDSEGRIYFPRTKQGELDRTKRLALKRYLLEQKGQIVGNLWDDISALSPSKADYWGYPTQKPLPLLERIIKVSSKPNDIVLDAFCGCGTALVAAQKLKRRWIGIDISPTACRVMAQRLWKLYGLIEDKDFRMYGLPRNEEELRAMPHFEFQNWAVIALGGIPNRIKSGDYGIDGKLYPIEQEKALKEDLNLFGAIDTYYPIQVKQKDKAGRPDIDAFQHAMRRDKRHKGYFISFDFTRDAIEEIKRAQKTDNVEVIPITVKELLADLK